MRSDDRGGTHIFQDHTAPLVASYFAGLCGFVLASRVLRDVWPAAPVDGFARPWREFAFALLGAIGVVAMGQSWSAGIHLPEHGALGPLFAAIDQFVIFLPILVVIPLRRQRWTSAWLPRERLATRLAVGVVLAVVSVTAYALLRDGADAPWRVLGRIARFENLGNLVQVFLEDVTIAILFVRLAAAIGARAATIVVACLFAAGHVPVMLQQGASVHDLLGLVRDAALGVAVIFVLNRSRDVVWFCCIHFCLDMTQFPRITGVG